MFFPKSKSKNYSLLALNNFLNFFEETIRGLPPPQAEIQERKAGKLKYRVKRIKIF